jgi:hypothetical protein
MSATRVDVGSLVDVAVIVTVSSKGPSVADLVAFVAAVDEMCAERADDLELLDGVAPGLVVADGAPPSPVSATVAALRAWLAELSDAGFADVVVEGGELVGVDVPCVVEWASCSSHVGAEPPTLWCSPHPLCADHPDDL